MGARPRAGHHHEMLNGGFQLEDGVDGLHEKRDTAALNDGTKGKNVIQIGREARVKRRVVNLIRRSDGSGVIAIIHTE